MRVAVVGLGYWGPKVVRNLLGIGCEVVANDLDEGRYLQLKSEGHQFESASWDAILSEGSIQSVVIATPVDTHYSLASRALEAGKHVLVEKPIATSVAEASELQRMARTMDRVLMVGHTFLYSASVRKIQELVASGSLGRVILIDSVRANLGIFRSDVNVLFDLAVHDLSILDFVLGVQPQTVRCVGIRAVQDQHESVCYLTLMYPTGVAAHIGVNWISPVKIRQMFISGSKQMLIYDDTQPLETVKVFDYGISSPNSASVEELRVQYRTGDIWIPHIQHAEPLRLQLADFLSAIRDGAPPLSDAESGIRVLKILEAAQISIQEGATEVTVGP